MISLYLFFVKGQPDGPVSIFWDIENVAIPFGTNAFDIVMKLRKRLIEDRKVVEGVFKTYYRNINNIPQQHRTDLHHANVLVQHIESNRIGAVDVQIHRDLQQFIDQHRTPATVVLISSDIDFVMDINELRFRHGHYTIVIHNPQVKDHLLKTANEFISWEKFLERKCRSEYAGKSKNPSREVNQTQMPRTTKPKHTLRRSSSPKHNLDKTRTSTPSSICPSLMELNVDMPAMDTDSNVLETTPIVATQCKEEKPHHCAKKPDVLKNEARSQKKHHKNENKYVLNNYC